MRLLIVLALLGCEKKLQQDAPPPPRPVSDESQPPAVAPRTPDLDGLPSECQEYRQTMEALTKCQKMPPQSIDALKQGFDAMARHWVDNQSLSGEARKAMADGCKQGTDALKQAASAICGVEQPPPPSRDMADLPRECAEYRRMTDVIVKCDKIPMQARDALEQAYELVSQTWDQQRSLPPEGRANLARGCKEATDALKQVAANACDLQLEKPE